MKIFHGLRHQNQNLVHNGHGLQKLMSSTATDTDIFGDVILHLHSMSCIVYTCNVLVKLGL